MDLDVDNLKRWIGAERISHDTITPRLAASLAAVLDAPTNLSDGDAAPVGIHWCLSPEVVPMHALGPDGHPARGDFLPPVPLPRRMWAGGELLFSGDFRVGDTVRRRSQVTDVAVKSGRSGVLCFVTVRHDYSTPRGLALQERHDIVYRGMTEGKAESPAALIAAPKAEKTHSIAATPVLLMRYSAATFNGHRIHYDRSYCQTEESYPGLVVHGPLQATYLLQLACQMNANTFPARFSFRGLQPLFDGAPFSVNGKQTGPDTSLWVENASGAMTMQASAGSQPG
ncbi:MAG: MaoC family dehydratase N-terminal domain-containing protein [Rhodobacteraceae bacterium]|nr:MaoC family dehydratase N-terminal domain-containing protein [Paracoccaceae bacterium]